MCCDYCYCAILLLALTTHLRVLVVCIGFALRCCVFVTEGQREQLFLLLTLREVGWSRPGPVITPPWRSYRPSQKVRSAELSCGTFCCFSSCCFGLFGPTWQRIKKLPPPPPRVHTSFLPPVLVTLLFCFLGCDVCFGPFFSASSSGKVRRTSCTKTLKVEWV